MIIWIILALLIGIPAIVLGVPALRRSLVTPHIFALFKRILPAMSDTERDALEAGTTWWDADLFSGRPDWNRLMKLPKPTLTAEEQSFLDVEVRHLCELVDDWESTQVWQGIPAPAWQYARDKGFLLSLIHI